MLLFRDEEHVERWCAARELTRGAVVSADQAWQLAQGWYGRKLEPDWRRHRVDEAEALLARIGLVGDAWNLRA